MPFRSKTSIPDIIPPLEAREFKDPDAPWTHRRERIDPEER